MKKKHTILLTGVGAPGVQGTLYSLREIGGTIIGTDADESAVGQYLCDEFHTLPLSSETDSYLTALTKLCEARQVDAIVPQNTAELQILANHKQLFSKLGTHVLVSNPLSIEQANNKYHLLQVANSLEVPTGEFTVCEDIDSLRTQVEQRRSKGLLTVVKPPCGNGSRGVRVIIDAHDRDRCNDFYHKKPSSLFCTLDELHAIIGDEFPELLVMDYLEGEEYTVDILRTDSRFIAIPRKREVMRCGITFRASLERDKQIIEACRQLSDAIDLEYCFGFQFKRNREGIPILLECNPRIQGTMVMSAMAGANIIAEAVRALLGEPQHSMQVDWNTRLIRYWGAVGVNESGVAKI